MKLYNLLCTVVTTIVFLHASYSLAETEPAIIETSKITLQCPPGTERVGGIPPKQHEVICRKPVLGGYMLEGGFVKYHGNGHKRQEGEFHHGMKDGKWIAYSRHGKKLIEEKWTAGKREARIKYDHQGKALPEKKATKRSREKKENDNWRKKLITPRNKPAGKVLPEPFK